MAKIENLVIQNTNVIQKIPGFSSLTSRYLHSLNPIQLSNLQFHTNFSNSYALFSEKSSVHFNRVMKNLESYIGTGPIGPNKHWEYPWTLANLRLRKGMKVLDAGCGKSPLQFIMSNLGCKVFGIDNAENVQWHGIDRNLSKRFGCSIEYRKESLVNISYKSNTFDRICCVSVIEHCRATSNESNLTEPLSEDDYIFQKKIIEELIRVLKPEGILVLTVDFNIPRDNCLMESNVSISNILSANQSIMFGTKCSDLFPGEDGFDFQKILHNSDIDIENYGNTLQTSIGITLQKTLRS